MSYVFWANGYGKGGICLKLTVRGENVTAEEAWKTSDMVCHHGGYIIQDGYIYGNGGNGWSCIDVKTGETKWRERGVGKGSCCWADDMLYLFSEKDGHAGLATCSPDGLEMRGPFSVEGEGYSWAYPVVIGGRLYLRYDTHLYCFDVRASRGDAGGRSLARRGGPNDTSTAFESPPKRQAVRRLNFAVAPAIIE